MEIDFETGKIKNITKDEIYQGQSYPKFVQKIIERGGLVNYIKDDK